MLFKFFFGIVKLIGIGEKKMVRRWFFGGFGGVLQRGRMTAESGERCWSWDGFGQ